MPFHNSWASACECGSWTDVMRPCIECSTIIHIHPLLIHYPHLCNLCNLCISMYPLFYSSLSFDCGPIARQCCDVLWEESRESGVTSFCLSRIYSAKYKLIRINCLKLHRVADCALELTESKYGGRPTCCSITCNYVQWNRLHFTVLNPIIR